MSEAEKPELRIGLVLYGGVALAVYIYGVVVEVQRLLRAAELEGEQSGGYGEALRAAGLSRASVDVIAGTSAGGINGVLLAKAIAVGADVGTVRRLWLEGGDIGSLMQRLESRSPRSLLDTEVFERCLQEGFDDLDAGAGWMRPGSVLDLFVSSTHIRGDRRRFIDALGGEVRTLLHRYVFQLKLRSRYHHDDFSSDNGRLVTLSRATSAFPVAFAPVEIDADDHLLGPHDEPSGWFADGGILNNKPFTEALGTIFTRAADRPVRRWLLSVDPDPKLASETRPGPQPGFDEVAVRAVTAIPRYQSLAHDLESLEEHNTQVRRIAAAVLDLERDLQQGAAADAADTAYEHLRERAWAAEIADQLMPAVVPDDPGEFAPDTSRTALTEAALDRIRVAGIADLAFQRRRVYYLLKLLTMAVSARVEKAGDAPDIDGVRVALWDAFEAVSQALWDRLAAARLERIDAAADRIDAAADAFGALAERVAQDVDGAVTGVALELPAPPEADGGAGAFRVELADVFEGFRRRDALLLPIQMGGGVEHRDLVSHAQISPETATAIGIDPELKLAGDIAGHFGGFLKREWRENDLLWGRLDGAEVVLKAVLAGSTPAERQRIIAVVHDEIAADELKDEIKAGITDWRALLRERAAEKASIGDLRFGRQVGLGTRAGVTLRRMLSAERAAAERAEHEAAESAEGGDGGFRVGALRFADRFVRRLAYVLFLPRLLAAPFLRKFARDTEKPSDGD